MRIALAIYAFLFFLLYLYGLLLRVRSIRSDLASHGARKTYGDLTLVLASGLMFVACYGYIVQRPILHPWFWATSSVQVSAVCLVGTVHLSSLQADHGKRAGLVAHLARTNTGALAFPIDPAVFPLCVSFQRLSGSRPQQCVFRADAVVPGQKHMAGGCAFVWCALCSTTRLGSTLGVRHHEGLRAQARNIRATIAGYGCYRASFGIKAPFAVHLYGSALDAVPEAIQKLTIVPLVTVVAKPDATTRAGSDASIYQRFRCRPAKTRSYAPWK